MYKKCSLSACLLGFSLMYEHVRIRYVIVFINEYLAFQMKSFIAVPL